MALRFGAKKSSKPIVEMRPLGWKVEPERLLQPERFEYDPTEMLT
jgi:hypothetical protein